jgi:hypothetical protein
LRSDLPSGGKIIQKALESNADLSSKLALLKWHIEKQEKTIEKLRIGYYKSLNSNLMCYDGTVDLELPREKQMLFDAKIA